MFVMVSVEGLDVTVNGSKEVDKIFFLVKKRLLTRLFITLLITLFKTLL